MNLPGTSDRELSSLKGFPFQREVLGSGKDSYKLFFGQFALDGNFSTITFLVLLYLLTFLFLSFYYHYISVVFLVMLSS
jgi:hypothetical protein